MLMNDHLTGRTFRCDEEEVKKVSQELNDRLKMEESINKEKNELKKRLESFLYTLNSEGKQP